MPVMSVLKTIVALTMCILFKLIECQTARLGPNKPIVNDLKLLSTDGEVSDLMLGKLYRRWWFHESPIFPNGLWLMRRNNNNNTEFNYQLTFENGVTRLFNIAKKVSIDYHNAHLLLY